MFLEFWKRRQAAIQYDWDVADFEEEEVSESFSENSEKKFANLREIFRVKFWKIENYFRADCNGSQMWGFEVAWR